MKTIWLAGIGLVAVSLSACSPSKQTAATVNGHEISRDALEQRLMYSTAAKGTLQTLILEQLIIDEAAKQGIKITDEDVNRYIAYRRDRMPPGRFEEINTQNGMPEAVRRADARAELALRALALKDAKISDESIQKVYDEKERNQYIKPDWRQVGLVIAKDAADAKKAVASLEKGADFAAVSKEFTIPQAQSQAGNLQWIGIVGDDLVTEQGQSLDQGAVASAIRKTPVGKASEPVPLPAGPGAESGPERLVVFVKSETKGGKFPLADVRNEIMWRIANENNQVKSDVIQELVKEAKVDVKMDQFQDLEKPEVLLPEQPMMPPGGGMAPPPG